MAACAAARAAQPAWAAVPAPVRGQGDPAGRPPRRGQQGGARPARHARDRQAAGRVARRGPGDRRHVRLLPRRGAPAVRPDRPERDARQAALHLPPAGRRRGHRDRRATSPSRSRAGTSCRRCCAATPSSGSPRSTPPRCADALARLLLPAASRRRAQPRARRRGRRPFDGLEQALERGLVDKVGFTGSSAVGRRIGELCGRHLQSPCLELGGKNPLVVMDDADLDLAVEGALFSGFGTAGQRCTSLGTADRPRGRPRRVPGQARPARSRTRRSATRRRTSSTGR